MKELKGVKEVVDMDEMREGIKEIGGEKEKINKIVKVDIVIEN